MIFEDKQPVFDKKVKKQYLTGSNQLITFSKYILWMFLSYSEMMF